MSSMPSGETTRSLLLANGVTLALALLLGWPVDILLWPYWLQSAVIGIVAARRLALLPRNANADAAEKRDLPPWVFFTIFYGGWFGLFLGALVQNHRANVELSDVVGIVVAGVVFAANHWFSYRKNLSADLAAGPDVITLVFAPLLRAAPMFVGCYAAQEMIEADSPSVVGAFAAAKTFVDVLLHRNERRYLRRE